MSTTKKYVENLQKVRFENLSEKTIIETKKVFIDTLGCMIAGTNSPIGKVTIDIFSVFKGKEESSIIGKTDKLPAALAAYINAETCVGPDLSDNYQPKSIIISHPGEAVIPAVLALAEKKDATLKELFTAIVVGYETAGRYAKAIEPRRPEVYSFSPHYTLAAAAGCGRIMKFDTCKMEKNFGVAAALSSLPLTIQMWGFRDRPASWHRDMPGHTNFSAVLASSYADTEFEASHKVFDPEMAFYKIAGSDNYDENCLFENWGKGYVIDEITFKLVPS